MCENVNLTNSSTAGSAGSLPYMGKAEGQSAKIIEKKKSNVNPFGCIFDRQQFIRSSEATENKLLVPPFVVQTTAHTN